MSSLCRDHWITHVAYAKVGSVSWENETSTPGLTFYVLPSSYPTLAPCILISMTTKRPQKIMCALMMGYVANDGRARTGRKKRASIATCWAPCYLRSHLWFQISASGFFCQLTLACWRLSMFQFQFGWKSTDGEETKSLAFSTHSSLNSSYFINKDNS